MSDYEAELNCCKRVRELEAVLAACKDGSTLLEVIAERDRYRDIVEMYESWMKRSKGRHHGTVWNDISKEYPYLDEK